jgi:Xaa-Pro aminopeptidase
MKINPSEYLSRAKRLRAEMALRNLDALLFYGWKRGQIFFISGYYPNYIANVAIVLLPRADEPALRIRFPFDLDRVKTESWIKDVGSSGNVLNLAKDLADVCERKGLASARIGLVTGDNVMDEMPCSLFIALQKALPDVEWVEANDMVQSARLIKTSTEYEALRVSAKLADLGIRAAKNAIKPGCTEYEVVASAEAEMRKNGADAHLVVIASKGLRELIGPPENKILEPGDNVILEAAVQKDGYWTQVAQVAYVGGSTEGQSKIYKDTYQAFLEGVKAVRPGIPCSDVAKVIQAFLEDRGYGGSIEQDFGHGIGLDLPEPPRIEFKDNTIIKKGMVIVIHPSVRKMGVGGAFIGGTVLVHDDYAEMIHEIPEVA